MTRIYRARERKVSKTAKELGEQFHKNAFKNDDLRNALSQIITKVGESRSETRRLNWIAGRAQAALDGTEWPASVCAMPDPKNGKPKAERLATENKALQSLLNERDERIDRLGVLLQEWVKAPQTQAEYNALRDATDAAISPPPSQCGACAGCNNGCRVDAESPEICKYPQMCSSACGCVRAADEDWPAPVPHDYRTDLQAWWGLSYANWLTLPRVLMEAMPKEWQAGMAALLHDYADAIKNPPDLGVTVRTTHNGKLVAAPAWLNNYRHPDQAAIAYIFGKEAPAK